jgi:wyosine [tRNA(Phe)-imidazoG37] synthetase (radical SAM superfamily)
VVEPAVQNHWAAVRDHSRTFADLVFVYPVISRRSRGLSIGINLNPDKRCNFDCVYCEVDRKIPGRATAVDSEQLRDELTWLIRHARSGDLGRQPKFAEAAGLSRIVRDIAFSGDGEPTMIPNFSECVRVAADVKRAEGLEEAKLVLITDAAGLDKADVRRGLEIMDANHGEVWGKLDAGTDGYFRSVNRSFVRFDRILKNLLETARVRPIVIQSLFLKMHGETMPPEELAAYCDRLNEIVRGGGHIKEVHAYTIARPTPEPWATRLTAAELEAIAQTIRTKTGLTVLVFD